MALITQSEFDGVTLLRIDGGLTHDGVGGVAPGFESATAGRGSPAAAEAQPPPRVVVDLSDVPVLTTPGLSLLLAGARRVEQSGGRLVITGTRGPVEDLLRRCRLDAVFNLVADPDEAVRKAKE